MWINQENPHTPERGLETIHFEWLGLVLILYIDVNKRFVEEIETAQLL